MERVHVVSSDLESVGFENNVLEIAFNSGGIYQYFNVPETVYMQLLNASSKGRFFHSYIENSYRCIKIR